MFYNYLKYCVLTFLCLSISMLVPAQVGKSVAASDPDSVYVVDSVDYLPDSLELYEEQRQADFQEARDVLGESEVMKMFEALEGIPYFGEDRLEFDTDAMNVYGYDYGEIPVFDDSVYIQRIEQLASQTTIPLVYNAHVKPFIELYAMRRRSLMGRMLGLSYVYFPMFEEMLDKYNMPLELKYLAVVESALNPVAGSWAGAKGLWQFMYGTGKMYGLQTNSLVDERYDPLKETEAACLFMLDLYYKYKD